ncbi:MAG: ABC transporter ATP-binding protein [Anaeroplasmataceae bacterium]
MIKLLGRFRWYYWLLIIIIIGLVYVQVTLDLEIPDYVSKILALSYSTAADSNHEIMVNGLKMLGCAAGGMACTITVGFLAAKIASGFSHDLRRDVYKKVQSFSLEEIDKFKTSSLITRSTNDINQVQMAVVMFLRMAISAPLQAIKGIIKAVDSAIGLEMVIIVAVLVLVVVMIVLYMLVMPKFSKVQRLTDNLNLVTRENLTGLRVARAYNASHVQKEKFDVANEKMTKTNTYINRCMSLLMPSMTLIMNGASLGIIWLGAIIVNKGNTDIARVFAFQQYAMMIIMSFMMVSMLSIIIPRAFVSGKRIREVLDTNPSIIDKEATIDITELEEKPSLGIEFKNVSFKYPGGDENVLENISFSVTPGSTTAIIGGTGCGKSTLINLIPRLYDVTDGSVLIDGKDVRDIKQNELHDLIGYVPQKSVLFSGTIRSNLEYGKAAADDEEIDKALDISQASEFVGKTSEGANAMISQGGKNVSGGQKQRLCIARAIMKDPKIFIFDDSFSALDYKTDRTLREALNKESKATNIIVAQRIGTILNADQIIVLDDGHIVGIGKHEELLESCDVYKEIALSQMSASELNIKEAQ